LLLPSSGASLSAETNSICGHIRSEYMKEMYMLQHGTYVYQGDIYHTAEKYEKHQSGQAFQSMLSQN